jgi:hypothetical protein
MKTKLIIKLSACCLLILSLVDAKSVSDEAKNQGINNNDTQESEDEMSSVSSSIRGTRLKDRLRLKLRGEGNSYFRKGVKEKKERAKGRIKTKLHLEDDEDGSEIQNKEDSGG